MRVKASINKFNDAMDAMSRRDARLIQTFSYYDKPDYWISPAGCRVEQKIAELWPIRRPRAARMRCFLVIIRLGAWCRSYQQASCYESIRGGELRGLRSKS